MPGPYTLSEGCGALKREACSQGTSTKHRALNGRGLTPVALKHTSLPPGFAGFLASQNHAKPHTIAYNFGEYSDKVGGATQHPANKKSRHTSAAKCKAPAH